MTDDKQGFWLSLKFDDHRLRVRVDVDTIRLEGNLAEMVDVSRRILADETLEAAVLSLLAGWRVRREGGRDD